MSRRETVVLALVTLFLAAASIQAAPVCTPKNTVRADVVALDQAFYVNRLGSFQSGGMVFALRRDVISNDSSQTLQAGHVMLKTSKRPRPMVLRMNAGDCLEIKFQNLLGYVPQVYFQYPPVSPWTGATSVIAANPSDPNNPVSQYGTGGSQDNSVIQPPTRWAGVHVMGLEVVEARDQNGNLVEPISGDASFAGRNDITADISTANRASGLVPPGAGMTYLLHAPDQSEGSYLLYSTAANNGYEPNYGGQLMQGLFGAVTVQPKKAEYYRSQVTHAELWEATVPSTGQSLTATSKTVKIHGKTATVSKWKGRDVVLLDDSGDPAAGGKLHTTEGQPIINYQAVDSAGVPILNMTTTGGDGSRTLVHSDLTAIITGPKAGRLVDSPYAEPQPTPNGHQPWREFAIHYHDDFMTTLAFPQQRTGSLAGPLTAGRDFFAINYGIGGIGTEVLANRIGVGPMYQCATCAFEEFFLSSWTVGDPAMVVDIPANTGSSSTANPPVPPGPKAKKALYPDDPSNVYHSYVGDHVIFQILHAGTNITHVHHMHAQQWLHSPRNPNGAYRDSQMISPGASFSLNHVYNGSGNINKTIGDSIFHCHFYPHFAQGMWSMWRVHDMFEDGTRLSADGKPLGGWNRALPDGEIPYGTPTPAIVPLPTIGMPLMPARVRLIPVEIAGRSSAVGYVSEVHPDDTKKNPGYPFFIPGVAGQRAPHPPLDFAWEEDANGKPKKDNNGKTLNLDGGLPRHIGLYDFDITSVTNRWNFTKENNKLTAVRIPEEGTATEQVAMKFHEHRNGAGQPFYPSFTPSGAPSHFEVNGEPRAHGAPYANPNRDLNGKKQCKEESPVAKVLDPMTGEQPCLVRYKAVDIQIDAVFNKVGWHYPQTRLITLWGDVKATMDNKRMPEPFFFRANSEQIIEYWHSNLVPAFYELDDFQVRTPTDVIGQHIHLVKFDVTSADGAGNGYNYEDGTFGAETVRHFITAINQCPGGALTCNNCPVGLFNSLDVSSGVARPSAAKTCLTPKAIPYFGNGPHDEWLGAQATIQRWSADPVLGVSKTKLLGGDKSRHIDRTLRTVFTHDHFGPSTHQQAGLYAGLLIEPRKSYWIDGQKAGVHYGSNSGRPLGADGKPPLDGGPTGWQANIVDRVDAENSYREFALEFADSQLAYTADSRATPSPYNNGAPSYTGWSDPTHAVNPQTGAVGANSPRPPFPALVTFQFNTGTYSLNYRNEPLTLRVFGGAPPNPVPNGSDLSYSFASINRSLAKLNTQPAEGTPISTFNTFKYAAPFAGAGPTDPYTPLLRAYDGDNIQVRTLVGAHMGPHFFNFHGVNWLFEPQEEDSGYRSAQGMGISEHYEMIFSMPKTAKPTSDYLYEVTSDTTGRKDGNWGILRSYASDQPNLVRLPNNKSGSSAHPAGCPGDAPKRAYKVKALTIQDATGDPALFYNTRGQAGANGGQKLADPDAIIYVDEADLSGGKLKNKDRVEPLILRAAAGECVEVTLTNGLPTEAQQKNLGTTTTATPAFTGTFSISSTEAIIGDWWLALSGNFGQTPAFYLTSFKDAFNAAPGNSFGYKLPDSNMVSSVTWNCTNSLVSNPDIVKQCTTTIVDGANSYIVANDPADKTKLRIATSQSPSLTTSRRVGLHASLLSYDVTDSDGMNIGANPDQTLAPGASRTYRWYAGRYDRDDNGVWKPLPVEYGSVNLNPSDPLLQHPKGLIGALIVEPVGATWQPDQHSKASAIVAYKHDGNARSFREFVAVIQDDVSLQQTAANASWKNIVGDIVNNQPVWTFNEQAQTNNAFYVLKPGDKVHWSSQKGKHGVAFTTGRAAMESFFRVDSASVPLVDNPNGISGAYGTNPVDGPAGLVSMTVKDTAAGTLPFECSQHKASMAGTILVASHTISGMGTTGPVFWALDGAQQANNAKYTVKPGDVIVFESSAGMHGITFNDTNASGAQTAFNNFFTVIQAVRPLMANPNGIMNGYGTDAFNGPQMLLILQVKSTASGSLKFECTQHQSAMAGTLTIPSAGSTTIAGEGSIAWSQDGTAKPNNSTYTVQPGETVTFTSQAGRHGVTFLGSSAADAQAQFDKFFDVVTATQPLVQKPNNINNGYGTAAVNGPAGLVTLKVKSTATGSLKFECTQHQAGMAGTLTVGSGGSGGGGSSAGPTLTFTPANGQWSRAFNYKTEPLGYRYANPNFLTNDPALAPSGIMRAMSDQLTLSDPETPVFAAGAGQAVRIRMLHPAGIDEQVLNLHGHSWEEEPYVPGTASRVIGHNPQSQRIGSRDSFGPNVSWDLIIGHTDAAGKVIDGAGGAAGTKGDYMFRTFIGTDFLAGLWGILRVGDEGKDIVTVTYFPKPGSDPRFPPGMQGTVTANTSTGTVADKVEIFAGTSPGGAPVATAPINRNTGKWETAVNLPAPPLFVRSVCSAGCAPAGPWGSMVMSAYIPTSGQTAGSSAYTTAPPPATQPSHGSFGEVSNFKKDANPPKP